MIFEVEDKVVTKKPNEHCQRCIKLGTELSELRNIVFTLISKNAELKRSMKCAEGICDSTKKENEKEEKKVEKRKVMPW